jgi:serine/threonine-protein kinase
VWSLGVVLYERLTARSPFLGDTATAVAAAIVVDAPQPLSAWRDDLPPELEQVVMKALEKDREERYPDAAAFARALLPFHKAKAPALVAIDGEHRARDEGAHHYPLPSLAAPRTPTTEPSREGDAHPHIGGRVRIESEGRQHAHLIEVASRFVEAPIPSVAPSELAVSSSPSFPWDTAHAGRRVARHRMVRGVALGACGAGLLGLSGLFLPRIIGGVLAQGPQPGGPASMGSAAVLVGVLATSSDIDAGMVDSAVASPEPLQPAVQPASAPEPKPAPVPAPPKISRTLAAAHAAPIKTPVALATRLPPPSPVPTTASPTEPAPEPQPTKPAPRPAKRHSSIDLPDDPG